MLNIEIDHTDTGITVWRPVGDIDAFTCSEFRQTLATFAETAHSPRLLIDMSGVPFMDMGGIGALIFGICRTRELGGDMVIACNRPSMARQLHIHFDRVATVTDTIEEAAAAFEPLAGCPPTGEGDGEPVDTSQKRCRECRLRRCLWTRVVNGSEVPTSAGSTTVSKMTVFGAGSWLTSDGCAAANRRWPTASIATVR